MKLFITGAHSPSGQATLALALAAGHQVRAALAPCQSPPPGLPLAPAGSSARLSWVTVDWLEESGVKALAGMDAVLHLDEVEAGPFERQFLGTVQTTERLLQDMCRAQVRRLVLRSSLAVYGYQSLGASHWLDETSPLEPAPEQRSPYVQAKLMQEALLVSFGQCWGGQTTILRPGLIYGPGQLLGPMLTQQTQSRPLAPVGERHLGSGGPAAPVHPVSRFAWEIAPQARLPLLYLDHFAQAALAALDPVAIGETFNLVDNDLPSRRQYRRAIAPLRSLPWSLPCPWSLAQLALSLNQRAAGSLPQPGELTPAQLSAQFKPLTGYSNIKAKRLLDWRPQGTFREIMARIADQEQVAQTCVAAAEGATGGVPRERAALAEAEIARAMALNAASTPIVNPESRVNPRSRFNPGSSSPRPPAGRSA